MKLITLHRILVSTAIAFCAFFVFTQARQWHAEGSSVALWLAVGASLIAAALTWYLTNLRRFVNVDPRVDPVVDGEVDPIRPEKSDPAER